MKILFITHADFESPGYFETWATKQGYEFEVVKPYKNEVLPNADTFNFLIVMGGPQSPLEIEKTPYLYDEIKLIKEAVILDYPILGVCLGAQLIGEALGAKTERSPNKEIGSYPIELSEAAKEDSIFSNLPKTFDVMHWHSDMPGLTKDAKIIAASEGCPRQIIKYGPLIYGFQCHFEFSKALVEGLILNCPSDLQAGKYINTKAQLLQIDYQSINLKLDTILNSFKNRLD